MQAVCTAYDIHVGPRELAMLCQKVENSIVGAACGVMDQITAHCGVENSLVSLLCQPAEIGDAVKIPAGLELWGIDSGVRHTVAGSDYTSVRVGAFMGYRMIAEYAGLATKQVADGLVEVIDTRWRGFLANVSTAEYEREFSSNTPVSISGKEFLNIYGGTTDTVTKIDPARTYAVKAPTEHAIYESSRVQAFAKLLEEAKDDMDYDGLGELMFGSHKSYAACGLTESRTDRIVELVRENRGEGLFGARITGGGSGGTVAILVRRGSRQAIMQLAERFETETGQKPYIFHGSSPGCSSFGHLRLSKASE
jgi:L-arabinokinase